MVPQGLTERLARSELHAPGFHVPKRAAAHLDALRTAIRESRKIRVRYTRTDGEESERVLHPLGLFFWGTKWSLASWCEMRVGFRTFRLDRIRELVPMAETFAREPGRTLADYERMVDEMIEAERGTPVSRS